MVRGRKPVTFLPFQLIKRQKHVGLRSRQNYRPDNCLTVARFSPELYGVEVPYGASFRINEADRQHPTSHWGHTPPSCGTARRALLHPLAKVLLLIQTGISP
jgi:hypothetical protein